MRRDPTVVCLGEDIGAAEGVFKTTTGLFDEFGPERVWDTPISEQAIVGAALGAAMTGMRPVAEIMFSDFFACCYDYLANEIPKMRYMTGGQVTVPLVIRTANGGGLGFGAQHSQAVENWVFTVPGLKIAAPSTPADVVGMMASAIRSDDPVMFFEHKGLFASKGEPAPPEHVVPLGEAAVVRPGDDVTMVALASTVPTALSAAEQLAGEDISIEVIDLRCLVPLDARTVLESVARTSRLVVVEENPYQGGWGATGGLDRRRRGIRITRRTDPAGGVGMRAAPVRRRTGGRSDSDRRQGRRRGTTTRRFLREPKKPRQMQRSRADDNKDADPGGTVVSMDPQIGDLTGDVLIEDDKIVAVEPNISADAEVIDASDSIVIPGFVDTHRHTWEAAIRGCAPNATLDDYFVEVLDTFAPVYRAEDVHASNVAGSLDCLNAGITTLVDWSHINNTPDHADAAVTALQETGIRAQYAYGSANLSLADYWFNSSIAIPGDDVRRIRDTYFSSDDGLLTMGLATRGSGFCQEDVVRAEWKLARELDIPITIHVAMGRLAGRFAMIKTLDDYGLLGPDTTYIHCCHFSDEEWQLVKDSGGKISIAPQVELSMGHGWPPLLHSLRMGLRPSLSIDVVTTAPGDMFTEMRAAFCRRPRPGACREVRAERAGTQGRADRAGGTQAATIDGAYVAGVEDRTGSLTPGKQADIVIIEAKSLNMAPVIDPVAAVVLCADVSNVDTVLVAGQAKKRDGKLLADVDKARADVEASRDHLLAATAEKQQ